MLKTLVQLSADIHAKNAEGATPLHHATANGHVEAKPYPNPNPHPNLSPSPGIAPSVAPDVCLYVCVVCVRESERGFLRDGDGTFCEPEPH